MRIVGVSHGGTKESSEGWTPKAASASATPGTYQTSDSVCPSTASPMAALAAFSTSPLLRLSVAPSAASFVPEGSAVSTYAKRSDSG
ncbi:hypothetical protein ACFPRL_11090 [Pseudoclavibacter helvolus]